MSKGYNIVLAGFYNPFILITLSLLSAVVFLWDSSNYKFYSFIFTPYILYLIVYLFLNRIKFVNRRVIIPDNVQKICMLFIFFGIMINLSLLYQIYKLYGDAYNIFHYGGSTFYTQSIQEKSLQYINILAKFNYIAPNFLIPLIFKFEKRFLFVIMPFLILQGAFAVLYGTRIVIMTTILTILIAYTYRIKIDLKNATLIFATLLLVGVAVISGQSIRQNVSFGSGLTEVKRYYSTSLNNGSSVIENNLITQKLFWTLRPVLSIPFLPKATGFINMYEKLFGKLQIRNRKEDFSYAAKLGFDPAYNTFSSFGYAYLDLGRGGIFLLLLGWLTIQYIYIRARSGQILYLIIFPAFYISMLDQLRTYWFFSESNMYSLLSGIFILSLIKLASLHSKNKIYDQEKDI